VPKRDSGIKDRPPSQHFFNLTRPNDHDNLAGQSSVSPGFFSALVESSAASAFPLQAGFHAQYFIHLGSSMSGRYKFSSDILRSTIVILVVILFASVLCPAQGFPPISQDELKMTGEPQAPGAPAIILFREVDRDDNGLTTHEDDYTRIKILTEEGRQYGNVEIAFNKANEDVVNIRARTIHPDGSSLDFDGKVFEKLIEKAQGFKYLAKTFTLPDIQVGSIIEYRFTYDFKEHTLFESHWVVSSNLFTKSARFSLKPYVPRFNSPWNLRWSWQGLPSGVAPNQGPDHVVRMEVQNIPAFQVEDFMPPANELKARVDFIYEDEYFDREPDEYWRHVDKKRNEALESFVGKHKAMEEAVAQIVSPSDPPEVKLRKIYDRVQQIRNTTYEVHKSAQELKRDNEKPAENVEEVWKRGYGTGVQITWLYLGLVRAAGFEAYGVWASSRRNYFFTPKTMENRKLNANLVLVKLNGKDLYFDPGAAFTPFGMLTWSETGTPGLCLDKNGGTWVTTTLPKSSESVMEHNAKLKLDENGTLQGKVTATYTGLEAMYHRLDVRNADDVSRKRFLETRLKHQIPMPSEVELTNQPDWSNPETPLVAEYSVSIPGWASNAGKRTIVPATVFTAVEKRLFEHAERVHPIYIEYPYQKLDDVTIELPTGWQVSSVPSPQTLDGHIVTYNLKVESDHATLHLTRKLDWDFLLLEQKYYASLRNFFQTVRTDDDQQILLQPLAATAGN
jgi:hypothetical protein